MDRIDPARGRPELFDRFSSAERISQSLSEKWLDGWSITPLLISSLISGVMTDIGRLGLGDVGGVASDIFFNVLVSTLELSFDFGMGGL